MLVSLLIFFIWYPFPYAQLLGGGHLFLLIAGVDLACGPLLTLLIYNSEKKAIEKVIDFSVIAVVQLAALGYGLYAIYQARPIALIFEVDRFVVIAPIDIYEEKDSREKNGTKYELWSKPQLMATRKPRNKEEFALSLELSLQGVEPSARPSWWEPYESSRPDVVKRMRSISNIFQNLALRQKENVMTIAHNNHVSLDALYFLPLVSISSKDDWVAILSKNGEVLGFAMGDGFAK